jgi:hypothetical protein
MKYLLVLAHLFLVIGSLVTSYNAKMNECSSDHTEDSGNSCNGAPKYATLVELFSFAVVGSFIWFVANVFGILG